jgi:hypothetical protein
MFESPDKHNDRSSTEGERYWERPPEIGERDFAVLEEIGGCYRGVVESSDGKRYEDIRRDIKAVYDYTERAFARTLVETRAYVTGSDLQNASEIEGYRILVQYESLQDHKVTGEFSYDLTAKDAGVGMETLPKIAEDVHHLLANGLETLPKSQKSVAMYIHNIILDWKLEHLGKGSEEVENSWNEPNNDIVGDASETSSS